MPSTAAADLPTPDALDREAARLYDTAAWQQIVTGWPLESPEPALPSPATPPERTPADHWSTLLSVPVEDLVADAERSLPAEPPAERALPGRIGAMLPDRVHAWRRIGQVDIRPSTHLAYARRVLVEWGWQNTPYRMRDARGARCLCGALLTAHRLGYGSLDTANRSAAWLLTELRDRNWPDLIGPWNRAPERTAEQALALVDTAIRRAAHAGQ